MKNLSVLSLLLFCLFSCSSFASRNTNLYVIRYVDLPRVYAFAARHEVRAKSEGAGDELDDASKKNIYRKIKTAVSNVARRNDADFILNTEDVLLYSISSYDVTDDVIREYKKLSDISSPEAK